MHGLTGDELVRCSHFGRCFGHQLTRTVNSTSTTSSGVGARIASLLSVEEQAFADPADPDQRRHCDVAACFRPQTGWLADRLADGHLESDSVPLCMLKPSCLRRAWPSHTPYQTQMVEIAEHHRCVVVLTSL